jgi:hypothetical protein
MYPNALIQEEVSHERAASCAGALDSAADRLAGLPQLADLELLRDRGRLHQLLQQALEKAATSEGRTPYWLHTPWNWECLLDDGQIKAGVWTLFPRNPLPIHDEPGLAGLYLGLSGTVLQRRYERSHGTDLTEDRAVTLRLLETRTIAAGDWVDFGPDQNEIHCLAADHKPAVLLQILFTPEPVNEVRHWFLPIRPYGADEPEVHALPFRRESRGFA